MAGAIRQWRNQTTNSKWNDQKKRETEGKSACGGQLKVPTKNQRNKHGKKV